MTKNASLLDACQAYGSRVVAVRSIHPSPLDRDGRTIRRGECGYIEDTADGFYFVDFSGEIAMCDEREIRPK